MSEFIKLILNDTTSSAKIRLSTIFNPMIYYLFSLALIMPGLICSYIFGGELLFFALLGVFTFISIIYFIFYMYLVVKNPDALRSEEHIIQKIIAEKGLMGDINNFLPIEKFPKMPKSIHEPAQIPSPDEKGDDK